MTSGWDGTGDLGLALPRGAFIEQGDGGERGSLGVCHLRAVTSLKRRPLPNVLFMVSEVARLLLYWRLMSDYYGVHRDDLEGRLPTTGRVRVIEGERP
jgi:hypothetical protein